MFKDYIFRDYDVRGVFEEEFDLDFSYKLGQALATYIKEKESVKNPKISIARDARLSGQGLSKALSKGLQSCGAHVINLGQTTTSMCYFSTFHLEDLMGAVMITASHNPPNYNGFKISYKNYPLFAEKLQELKSFVEKPSLSEGGKQTDLDISSDYIKHSVKEFSGLSKIPVIVDCGNGAAGFIARKLYLAAGCDLKEVLFEEPDGTFPNRKPDTNNPEDVAVIMEKIKNSPEPCLGITLDGDADRVGIIAEDGRFVYADEFMTLFARYVLKENPKAKIVGDVKCSSVFFEEIEKMGGQAIMCRTGHSFLKNRIREENAPFGGELSGHIFFLDKNYGYDDGLYAGLRMLQILSENNTRLVDLLNELPKTHTTPEYRIPVESKKREVLLNKVFQTLGQESLQKKEGYSINDDDGMRITFKDGSWALVRASNTQSLVTLRFESRSKEGLEKTELFIKSIIDLDW